MRLFILFPLLPLMIARAAAEGPPAPQWIGVYNLKGEIGLTWIHNPRFSRVLVYRRQGTGEADFSLIGEAEKNSYVDRKVAPGETYTYYLLALGPEGEKGRPSNEQRITLPALKKISVSPPRWEGYVYTEKGVGLKWSPGSEGNYIAYNVYRRKESEPELKLLSSTVVSNYEDKELTKGEVYVYALTALDSQFKESGFSQEFSLRYSPPEKTALDVGVKSWRPRRSRLVRTVSDGDRPLYLPADVAVDPAEGDVYLSDSGTNTIQVFNSRGQFLRSYGGAEEGQASFKKILGLGFDSGGGILAVDAGSNRIIQLGPTGGIEGFLDMDKFTKRKELGLIDTAIDSLGRMFVVDNLNNTLSIVEGEKVIRSFGGGGSQGGRFSAPTFCTLDARGQLYISDALNGRVQVFDRDGVFLRHFGRYEQGPGGLGRPKGVAVNARGEVYVADSWQNVIHIFDDKGRFVALLTDEAGQPLLFGSPNGIALDSENHIYIAERLSRRLQIREIIDVP